MTSPGGHVHVVTGHLLDLSERQQGAATQIERATPLTAGEATAVQRSHGLICSATHAAASAAEEARANACAVMQVASESFAANLEDAAAKYALTDESAGERIDGEVPQQK
ncbi:MAG: type VII secretion target [Actinomycetota bacterium]|nr:type VII secretion target [Actinomycetota bacterium]